MDKLKTPFADTLIGQIFLTIVTRIKNRRNPTPDADTMPCQFCGQTDHVERNCPNLEKQGFV